jgi:hypothetical protein
MNLLDKYKQIKNTSSEVGDVSKKINNKKTLKVFGDDLYLQNADNAVKALTPEQEMKIQDIEYRKKPLTDEMEFRKQTSTDESATDITERINMPQGHLESADRISDDSKKNGVSPKKQMGNRTPLEIIAKILAGR